MGRLFKYLLFALAFAIASLSTNFVYAQTTGATSTPSPTSTATSSSPLPTRAADISATVGITTPAVQLITGTATVSATPGPLPTPAPVTATTDALTSTAPLEGTIIANRSQTAARFFLEGATYELAEGRSQGIALPRASTVLNLFNCPATLPVDTAGCFWDPYLIQQDGFYEIYEVPGSAAQVELMLREAGAPPTGQVWVQNRTGQTESLVFKDEVFEIPPTTVLEFPVATGVPAILYVRSCQTIDNQSACEWAPKTLDAGVYYAMVEVDKAGSQAGSTLTTIDLRPVVGEGEEADTAQVASSAADILCSVVVPALNVRSGPGLQYDIIGKVRADTEAATVNVTGRSSDNQWLTVAPAVAENGWINNSPSFINCSGDLASLPVVEAPPPPTPQPALADSAVITTDGSSTDQAAAAPPVEAPVETATPESPSATVPDGQAVLVVTNGFQHEMRFTIDQRFRPQDGPSEYDLAPGGSISIIVYPGDVAFTASSPWNGLSSNATVHVDANQSLPLWLRFQPDPDGSWVFHWN
ncbi:MAG: SH3 domain-containing protein [Caldilineaceae bacterium]|nr:SH3 domain-containing protein [Caldilineaceae bacterium]